MREERNRVCVCVFPVERLGQGSTVIIAVCAREAREIEKKSVIGWV